MADGVGSWEERGINAGLYSRMLMEQAALKERTTTPGAEAAQQILEAAHANTDAQVLLPIIRCRSHVHTVEFASYKIRVSHLFPALRFHRKFSTNHSPVTCQLSI